MNMNRGLGATRQRVQSGNVLDTIDTGITWGAPLVAISWYIGCHIEDATIRIMQDLAMCMCVHT